MLKVALQALLPSFLQLLAQVRLLRNFTATSLSVLAGYLHGA